MSASITPATWLTTDEAAACMRRTAETLVNWATAGRIPDYAWRALPKGYLFLASWVAEPFFTSARARPERPEMTANASK